MAALVKTVLYVLLLVALGYMVYWAPFLWELAIAGAIGGVWVIFFRQPQAGPAEPPEASGG